MVSFQRKVYFSKILGWGSSIFQGFQLLAGVQLLIPIDACRTCDFPIARCPGTALARLSCTAVIATRNLY